MRKQRSFRGRRVGLFFELLEDRRLLANTSGFPDLTFDVDGRALVDIGANRNFVTDAAGQSDGKIVIAGFFEPVLFGGFDAAIVRLNADGSPDDDFGQNGVLLTDLGNAQSEFINAVVIQPDDKIVVGGDVFNPANGSRDILLARFEPDGTFDTDFGVGGIVLADAFGPSNDELLDLALQSDGSFVMTGKVGGAGNDILVGRLDSNGVPDPSFGTDGWTATDIAGQNDSGNAVAIDSTGGVVVVGESVGEAVVLRYTPSGNLDTAGFGPGGVVIVDSGQVSEVLNDVVVQPDGEILAVGTALNQIMIARLDADGTPDDSFDGDGLLLTQYVGTGITGSSATGVALQGDGKILVAGAAGSGGVSVSTGLARFESDGTPDTTFGVGGTAEAVTGSDSFPGALILQNDGNVVVAGNDGARSGGRFVVDRYVGDTGPGTPDPPTPVVLGLDEWWATTTDGALSPTWTVDVAQSGNYRLDLDIEGFNSWDLSGEANVLVNGTRIASFNEFGVAEVGPLGSGINTFRILDFVVPTTAIVEPITFQLDIPGTGSVEHELNALFIADWPEVLVSGDVLVDGTTTSFSDAQELADMFAPIYFSDAREQFPVPVSVPSLQTSVLTVTGDEIGADGPRGSSDDWLDLSQFDVPQTPNLTPTFYASVLACPAELASCDGNQMALNYFFVTPRSNWADFGGFNEHEGDLEGIIVFFTRTDAGAPWVPDVVAFSQHTVFSAPFGSVGGELIPWDVVNREGPSVHAYASLGGHSTYNSAGLSWVPLSPSEQPDIHTGNGLVYPSSGVANVVRVPRVDDNDTPDWLRYPGSWGNPDLDGNGPLLFADTSPRGIAFQQQFELDPLSGELLTTNGRRWNDPWLWSEDFRPVTVSDVDGVSDFIEDGVNTSDDGNGDGQPDRLQSNVVSLPTALSSIQYVTLVTSEGAFKDVSMSPVVDSPNGVTMSAGQLSFDVAGLTPGEHVTVTYILPDSFTPNTFYKFDPDTGWYEFLYDAATNTGAQYDAVNNVMVVHYVDGLRGDADGVPNGIIEDPGAPAFVALTGSDVMVTRRFGRLRVIGTDMADHVQIEQLGPLTFRVTGLSGTTVNGNSDPVTVTNIWWGPLVQLKDGADTLIMLGNDHRVWGLTILTGAGADRVSLSNVRGRGYTTIRTHDGDDRLSITNSHFRHVALLATGRGDDTITLIDSRFRHWTVLNGGADEDTLELLAMDLLDLGWYLFKKIETVIVD